MVAVHPEMASIGVICPVQSAEDDPTSRQPTSFCFVLSTRQSVVVVAVMREPDKSVVNVSPWVGEGCSLERVMSSEFL